MIQRTREEIAGELLKAYSTREPVFAGLGSVTVRFGAGYKRDSEEER